MSTDRLIVEQFTVIALQKSAKGIVLESQEGLNDEEDAAVWLDHGYCTRRCRRVWGENNGGFQIWERNSRWQIDRSTLTIVLEGVD